MATYSKRPLWQWIVIYLVIGIIVYGIIYFVFIKGNYSQPQQGNTPNTQQQTNPY